MRKLLAVLLAAIMLVGALAALPVGAEAEPTTSNFDGTTSDTVMELIITEIVVDSATGVEQVDAGTTKYPDAFDYIEIYNAGSTPINLYELQILRAQGSVFSNKDQEVKGKFTGNIPIAESPLTQVGVSFNGQYDQVTNPATAVLAPGENAVIWFYTDATSALATYLNESEEVDSNYFKKHYGMVKEDGVTLDDTMVLAVCGKNNMGSTFTLDHDSVYALAYQNFDSTKLAISNMYTDDASLDDFVICMATLIRGTAPFSQYATNVTKELVRSACYVPASLTPDFVNEGNKIGLEEGETAKTYKDYYEAGHSNTYRGVAAISTSEVPTPGKMPAWQWAYVGADYLNDKASEGDAAMKAIVSDWATNTAIKKDGALNTDDTNGESAWISAAKAAYVTAMKANIDADGRADSTEQKIDYSKNFVDRSELEKRHGLNKTQTTNKKDGLPVWALILIIVGGVLLVGGAAVVVIIIIKKKNKPVAADDVAAEGEIEIIDETAASEVPVEEAAAEDAPVEETAAEEAPADENKE